MGDINLRLVAEQALTLSLVYRTLFVGSRGLEEAKNLLISYKQGQIKHMTPDLWRAKKIVDSTLHPDTGEPVFLPFRMSCFVLSNLVVTAGMLTPNLGVRSSPRQHNSLLTSPSDPRHNSLASRQPVPERRHQLLQRKQILPPLLVQDRPVLLPSRDSLLLRSRRPEQPRPPPQEPRPQHPPHPLPSGPLRRRRQRRCPERFPHAC